VTAREATPARGLDFEVAYVALASAAAVIFFGIFLTFREAGLGTFDLQALYGMLIALSLLVALQLDDRPTVRRGVGLGALLALAALSAAGVARVTVRRRPRVAIVITGDELRTPPEPLRRGQIYESNGRFLEARCAGVDADVVLLERATQRLGAAVGLAAFFVVELRTTQPRLDLSLFNDRLFGFAALAGALVRPDARAAESPAPVALCGSEEADVDPPPLHPGTEDLRYRQQRVGPLRWPAVAERYARATGKVRASAT